MTKIKITPVILSGGSGTRLWPLSRSMRPKQFINLVGPKSLFQLTVERIEKLAEVAPPIVVCNEEHRFMVAEQLRELGIEHNGILLEPEGRNTAPAIASAALKLAKQDLCPERIMLVLPADHILGGIEDFITSVEAVLDSAQNGKLATFGITPTKPATGYGYIRTAVNDSGGVMQVEEFIEKPDQKTADQFFESQNYFWNSGMFLFRADAYLKELTQSKPDIVQNVEAAVSAAEADLDFLRLSSESYVECESISIDYAVMEQSENVVMAPLKCSWSDIGSWTSLWEIGEKYESGNVMHGDVVTSNTENCYLHSENKLVATLGVKDLVVVETHDGVMISSMSHDQQVKEIVSILEANNRPETQLHRKAFRPWGNYDSLDKGDRFQVKRITVKGGHSTSMQKHYHRAEHWIVVSGTAEVTVGDKTFMLTENEAGYIPLGAPHRLKNPGKVPLELIEVQTGTYLGEDDIERMDDEYGRT